MIRRVALVTDSTASVPPQVAERLGISVIQLELQVGEELNDERRIAPARLAHAMRERTQVGTSPPPAPAFYWNYADAAAAGAEAIVSVHISGNMSQTCEAARQAAAEVNIPVHVVDSQRCGMSIGYGVIAAAEAAHHGAGPQAVLNLLQRRLHGSTQMIYVDTLEYLHRSGRIGNAQAWLGGALSIKPVLEMNGTGQLDPLAKGIGTDRALKKMARHAIRISERHQVDIGVEHFEAEDRAYEMVRWLRAGIPAARHITVEDTSAIIGAHSGPGALGVAISPV